MVDDTELPMFKHYWCTQVQEFHAVVIKCNVAYNWLFRIFNWFRMLHNLCERCTSCWLLWWILVMIISLIDCSQMTMDDPFLCLDLCYISALLHEGFGFNRTSALLVHRTYLWKISFINVSVDVNEKSQISLVCNYQKPIMHWSAADKLARDS